MPSLTDDVSVQVINKTVRIASKIPQTSMKVAQGAIKGICISMKGSELTTQLVMDMVKKVLHLMTSDVKFSASNINISELQKSGKISVMEASITKDVMEPFDKMCRKYKVKYKVMYDNGNKEYKVFFSAKNTELINACLQKASGEWFKKQSKEVEKGVGLLNQKKDSLRSKLTFFCSWAKKYNANREKAVEKERGEIQNDK